MSTDAIDGAPVAPGADRVERLLADLNPDQREAVTHGDGPLLVLAGAGSGKTRVADLPHRVAAGHRARAAERGAGDHVHQQGRGGDARAGGGARRWRVAGDVGDDLPLGLRADPARRGAWLGYKRAFTIYDEADSLRMVKRCMQELELDPKRYPPRAIRAQISSAKNQLTDAADYGDAAGSGFEEAVADVYNLYERRMVGPARWTSTTCCVRTVNLLELFADVRDKYRRIFRRVLVDEYQDTNRAQYRLLQLLAEEHRNLTVVGDEDQSIYGFRSADIRNILDFDRDFPTRPWSSSSRTRSTQTVLDAANAIIANNTERREKHSGRTWAAASPSRSPSSTTSTPRRATWPRRSTGWSRRARRGTGSRSSTA